MLPETVTLVFLEVAENQYVAAFIREFIDASIIKYIFSGPLS
jgi:hypothetical protein